MKGKAGITRRALAILIDEHYVEVENGPNRSKLHRLIKMYDGDPESVRPRCVPGVSPVRPGRTRDVSPHLWGEIASPQAHVCSGGELLAQPSRRIVEVDADSLIGRIF